MKVNTRARITDPTSSQLAGWIVQGDEPTQGFYSAAAYETFGIACEDNRAPVGLSVPEAAQEWLRKQEKYWLYQKRMKQPEKSKRLQKLLTIAQDEKFLREEIYKRTVQYFYQGVLVLRREHDYLRRLGHKGEPVIRGLEQVYTLTENRFAMNAEADLNFCPTCHRPVPVSWDLTNTVKH